MDKSIRTIMQFTNIDKHDSSIVGGKGVKLGELAQAGVSIPEGFVITSRAYVQFLSQNKLAHKIKALLSTAHFDRIESLTQIASHIKQLMLQTPLPEGLTEEILTEYHKLEKTHNPLVIIDVAPTTIVIPTPSFLGRHQTHTHIHGDANLIEKIKESWASLFEAESLSYRHTHGFDHFNLGAAIIVQRMLQTDISGVMQTCDPVTHDKSKILIRIKFGGRPSNHYTFSKDDFSVVSSQIDYYPSPLSDTQLIELAKLGKRIEQHYFFPQHIEWALVDNTLYIMHTRPLEHHMDMKTKKQKPQQIIKGTPVLPGIVTGFIRTITDKNDLDKISNHDIVVTKTITLDHLAKLKKARAIVSEAEADKKLSVNIKHLGIPTLSNIKDATTILKPGTVMTVNATKGEMHSGGFL